MASHRKESMRFPVGATSAEVDALELKLGVRLPQAYREFLGWMGKDHLGPLKGSGWFIDSLFSNRAVLAGILEEVGSRHLLKRTDVVFFSHQGYMSAWFDADAADPDPVCWFMGDDMLEPRACGTFSQVLLNDLRGLISGA